MFCTWLALGAAGALGVLLTACSGGAPAPQVDPAPKPAPATIVVVPPVTATLTIYSGRSESLVAPIIQQFSAATGIKVSVKYAGTAQLAATLLEEGRRTPADVYFAQDPGGLGAVESMLAPLPQPVLDRVPVWARSPQGKWVGLSGRARTVVYNTGKLKETDLPDDIFDLTQPQWRGRIGWVPSNASFQTMVTAMRALWGEDKTRQWLVGMQANRPKVYSGNAPAVQGVADGEVDLALVNHYYIYPFIAERGESFPVRNYHPRAGGPGAIVMVAGAGVLEASQNKEAAHKFLEFMLSPVAQQYFAAQTYEYPVVEGVKIQAGLATLAQIKSPEVSLTQLADLKGTQALLRQTGVLP
ncbi:MAG: iron ABC transporter substrate-binding protein [Dehalococcoidia bacterium]|nr:iron ABC transporter substrate-binding protein [Dehalococcoidia bacterium]MSQ16828.1 iron ABC transporter substrate-binding protein [Dehalococcoidia bacterium]